MIRTFYPFTIALSVSALAISLSAPALAQPPRCQEPALPPSTPEIKAKIKSLYDDGVDATKREDWKSAHVRFLEAWKLNNKHVQIAANLGWAEIQLSMYRDAAEHLYFFLKHAPSTIDPAERKRIQDMFDQVRKRVGELVVKVNVDGAWLFMNKRALGCSPMKTPVFVEAGPHLLEARIDGYATAKVSIDVEGGAALRPVELKLVKADSPEDAAAETSARNPGEDSTGMKEDPKHKTNTMLSHIGLGATGAALVSTGVFAGLAISYRLKYNGLYDDYANCAVGKSEAACLHELEVVRDKRAFNANAALGMGIATGILGASVLSYWLAAPLLGQADKTGALKVNLHAGPGGAGVNFGARW